MNARLLGLAAVVCFLPTLSAGTRSVTGSMRHGSRTSMRDSTGVERSVPGGSGQGTPSSSHPSALGPTGQPSKVHSSGAGRAALPHTVPQRRFTCVVRASP